MHQDVGASNRTRSQYDFLANVDGCDGTTFETGKLNAGSSEFVIKDDLRDGGIRQDVQIGTRRQRIYVGGAGIGTRPVRGVNGGSCNESSPSLAPRRVGACWDSHVLEGGDPTADDGKNTETGGRGVP